MTDITKPRIREACGTNKATSEVLFWLFQEEDNYKEYVESTQDNENTFETILNHAYADEVVKNDLENTFEDLVHNGINDGTYFQ